MSDHEADKRLEPLSQLARQVADGAPADPAAAPTWDTFVAARAVDQRARRRRVLLGGASGVVALVVVAAGAGSGFTGGPPWFGGDEAPLTFRLDGGTSGREGYIPRVQGARSLVKFSDGTAVTLQQGSRAWVVSTDEHGARIRLEEGEGHFAVRHRPGARWAVEAGPYTVDVTGTEFDVSWAGADDRFEVHLVSGSVTVRGPLAGDGIKLRPGQRFRGTTSEGAVGIEPVEGEGGAARGAPTPSPSQPAVAAAAEPAGSLPVAPTSGPAEGGTPAVRRSRPALAMRDVRAPEAAAGGRVAGQPLAPASIGADWRRLVARGQFHVVIREAEDFGIDEGVAQLPSDLLMALADAARYTARPELARRVLVAQRQRFGGTPAASDAAFLLGRLAEDTGAPLPSALGWYDRYLLEAPKGSYAAEALGRKMLALIRTAGASDSRAVAREYLERYPNGQYVAQARGILESQR